MLGRDGDDPVAASSAAFSTVPLSAQLSASVALPVKATLPPLQADRLLDLLARDLDRRRGLVAPARRRMRVGELLLDPGLHRLGDFGRDGRRRLIIEVDHAASRLARLAIRRHSARKRSTSASLGARTEADAEEAAGDLGRHAHRREHAARLHAARRAGAARRDRNAGEVELHELAGACDARHRDRRRSSAMRGASSAITTPPAALTPSSSRGAKLGEPAPCRTAALPSAAANAERSGHVLRSRGDSPSPARRPARASPSRVTSSTPMPGGPPSLCAQAAMKSASGSGILPALCAQSASSSDPAARIIAAIRSIGWMTPVSLLTCWIATSAGPSASTASQRRFVDQPVAIDRNDLDAASHRVRRRSHARSRR